MASDESTSIFGLLTARNPNVKNYESPYKSQTRGTWHTPKKLQRWTEFSFSALRHAYNGELLVAAKQAGPRSFRHPRAIPNEDLFVNDEFGTVHIYGLWNRAIVNEALKAVQRDFNSSIWTLQKSKKIPASPARSNSPSCVGRRMPARAVKRTDSPAAPKAKRLQPDGGAVPHYAILPDKPPPTTLTNMERLPKDYKTHSKWKCEDLESALEPTEGVVPQSLRNSDTLLPIRQIFTYCVDLKCRYGCLLTTGEAIIIRVRHQREPSGMFSMPHV